LIKILLAEYVVIEKLKILSIDDYIHAHTYEV